MSDYVFEINPDQYLYRANENKCFFVIHKCRLPGKNKDLFLVGDAFLRHFYSVYDFDQDQISLGINTHSQGKVSMYKPGERPADAAKTETAEDNVVVTNNSTSEASNSTESNATATESNATASANTTTTATDSNA
jgi:hypothetical protein